MRLWITDHRAIAILKIRLIASLAAHRSHLSRMVMRLQPDVEQKRALGLGFFFMLMCFGK
jgi:hypothetical protein